MTESVARIKTDNAFFSIYIQISEENTIRNLQKRRLPNNDHGLCLLSNELMPARIHMSASLILEDSAKKNIGAIKERLRAK